MGTTGGGFIVEDEVEGAQEGGWWGDGYCGYIGLDVEAGDVFVVWGALGDVSGPSSTIFAKWRFARIEFTASGHANISADPGGGGLGILIHQVASAFDYCVGGGGG